MVNSLWIAPSAGKPLQPISIAHVEKGKGILGDRYHAGIGSFSRWQGAGRAVTLISIESLDAIRTESGIDLRLGLSRRNIVTSGIDLHALIGRPFQIGSATFRGSRICHPCRYLERLVEPRVYSAMKGHGGIRAEVLETGVFAVGDAIIPTGRQARLP